MKVNEAEDLFMASGGDLHWFSSKCDSLAMESILNDKDIEEKINKHIKEVIDKIFEIDGMITKKIDTKEFDSRIKKFSNKNLDIISSLKA